VNFWWKIARVDAELMLEVLLRLLVKFQAEGYVFIVLLVDRVELNGSGECEARSASAFWCRVANGTVQVVQYCTS